MGRAVSEIRITISSGITSGEDTAVEIEQAVAGKPFDAVELLFVADQTLSGRGAENQEDPRMLARRPIVPICVQGSNKRCFSRAWGTASPTPPRRCAAFCGASAPPRKMRSSRRAPDARPHAPAAVRNSAGIGSILVPVFRVSKCGTQAWP